MMTPSFALDFTSANLDSRVTFSRAANTATVVNSAGSIVGINADLPRFDYNPVTLACRGLLVEEARTNIALRSEEFNDAYWSKTNASVTADSTTSPAGVLNGDTLIENNLAGEHHLERGLTVVSGASYSISLYVKSAGSTRNIRIFMFRNSSPFTTIAAILVNPTTGAIVNGAGSVVDAGNGWWRITASGTAPSTGANLRISLASGGTFNYTGDGVSGVHIWGVQVEAGAFPTSYIPTVAATVTRNADIATITSTNFSDWWQASKGGVLVRARPGTVSGTRPWVQFDDGTANEIIALRGNTTNPELYIVDGGVAQAQIDAGTIAANTDYSLTGWWATNDCKARLDSGAVVTDTSATIPTVTQARLGSDGTNYLNGHLASISYYDSFSEQIYTRRKNKAVFSLL